MQKKLTLSLSLLLVLITACVELDEDPAASFTPTNQENPTNQEAPPHEGPELAPPVPGQDPTWVGGRSVQHRPIIVEHFGETGPVLYFTSAIHGQERLAVSYAERFRTSLLAGFAEDHGIQVVFMQVTNPDGTAVYERYNARGVDLNRNFPTANYQSGPVSGPSAMSEPETAAMKSVIDASALTAGLTLHCCVPTFDPDGPGEELAQAMSAAMDPAYRFAASPLGAASGSMGSYVGLDMGKPIITVEFAGSQTFDPLIQMAQMDRAVAAAADWVRDNGDDSTVQFASMATEDTWSLRSYFAGQTPGGLPLRVELLGEADAGAFLLLSGLDGADRLGPWIAEHIRRELLAVPRLDLPLWYMITGANPDGLRSGHAANQAGRDIASAIAEDDRSVAEAAAVLDLLDGGPTTVFLVENSPDAADRVALLGPGADDLQRHIPARFQQSIPSEHLTLANALADAGHTVVQILVGTENAEAQIAPGNWVDFDTSLHSPMDFSEMIFRMGAHPAR